MNWASNVEWEFAQRRSRERTFQKEELASIRPGWEREGHPEWPAGYIQTVMGTEVGPERPYFERQPQEFACFLWAKWSQELL